MTAHCTACGAPEGGVGDRGLGRDKGLWRDPGDGAVYCGLAGGQVIGYARGDEFDSAYSRALGTATDAQLERLAVPKAVQLVGGLCQLCRKDLEPKTPRTKPAKPAKPGTLL